MLASGDVSSMHSLQKVTEFLPNPTLASQGQFHAGLAFEWFSLAHDTQIRATPFPFPNYIHIVCQRSAISKITNGI